MLSKTTFITPCIAFTEYQDSSVIPEFYTITPQALRESYRTIQFPADKNDSVSAKDEFSDIRLLFGSWVEDGDEDKHLEELYKSRFIPSSVPIDE
jgi:hypothetical protein